MIIPQPPTKPAGFPEIIIDTREQNPLAFPPEFKTSRETLTSGDYSLRGYDHRWAVERKSLPDWYGSITSGRKRFTDELERLSRMERAFLLIEADGWREICQDSTEGVCTAEMSYHSMLSFSAQFNVIPIIVPRTIAPAAVLRVMVKLWRDLK